ncbi:DUF6900 domain-containing protein [Pelomonas aquatica]|jgi:hypothetical protein|uniref:DUF6900 domain-containing protein n=1 Tax=Pelomonas aquatica TaxID=431058 RepID=A0A9X4LLA5_9BURK|nr:hypothetical protein [Pelomonas aquatica]MCY4754891.1 hypothetical protein [Pelomonas aquatica]MDG0865026.1 hypothetical protein [Pelomonas aquatica]
MSNFSDDQLADLRERLHDLMMGFARGDSAGMAALVRADWALAARIEQLRRHPLVSAFDDEVLSAVAAGDLSPNVEARYLAIRLREVEAEAAADDAAAPRRQAVRSVPGDGLPALTLPQMEATIALIARRQLGFPTLKTRGRDHLDFRDCGVASVHAALVEAYEEGWHAAA